MNRNYIIYCSLCAFVLLFSCGNNTNKRDLKSKPINQITYPFTIDLSKTYPKETISLQELFGEMEYVALETKEECLIFRVTEEAVYVDGNSIFIRNGGKEILRFSRDGKFLNQVCREGRGPGELLAMTCYTTNSNTEEVFVLDILSQQISVFDYSGKFKRRVKTHGRYSDISVLNDSVLVASTGTIDFYEKQHLSHIFNPYLLISAKDGSIIEKILAERERINLYCEGRNISFSKSGIKYNGSRLLGDFTMDTTYLMRNDGELEPHYIKTPYLKDTSEEKKQNLCAAFETDNSTYFLKTGYEILINRTSFFVEGLRLDKFTGEIYNTTIYNADIKDDLNNKMVFIVVKQPPFCMHYEAVQLVELRDAGKLSGKLAEVAAGLTEEDNPVIMIQK